jgi:hypothetical protein
MKQRVNHWRPVRRPLTICVRKGWQFGRYCLVSPHGTVFVVRRATAGLVAQQRRDFQLKE